MKKHNIVILLLCISISCQSEGSEEKRINPLPSATYIKLNRNMVETLIKYQKNQGFLPKKGCKLTGSGTILSDGQSIEKLQRDKFPRFLKEFGMNANNNDTDSFFKWLCTQNDMYSTIYQRLLDMYTIDQTIAENLYKSTSINNATVRTIIEAQFAAYYGHLPKKQTRKQLTLKNKQQELANKIEFAAISVLHAYNEYKKDIAIKRLEQCTAQGKSTSIDDINKCLEANALK